MTPTPVPSTGWRRHAEPRDVVDAVRIGTLMLACGAGVIMVKSLATLVLFGPVSAAGRHQGAGLVLVNTCLLYTSRCV